MSEESSTSLIWVVLTMGDRPHALERSVESLSKARVLVVLNGASETDVPDGAESIALTDNVGVPAGRDRGLAHTNADIVGFLDDDAVAPANVSERIRAAFAADSGLGAVALRLIDEEGETLRRHVPRPGGRNPHESGCVALFLGGACAIRREAYEDAGGYFTDLFYGHEELELSWRLIDRGWSIRYLADVEVFHPRTTIERHAAGWELTGRNRVLIARRTLPWPIALAHCAVWLLLGARRAPKGESRRRYLAGWRSGWGRTVDRAPISWRTVWRLTRLGRPPVI